MHCIIIHSYGLIISFYITRDASTSEGMTVQSAAVFGAVGGALSVVMVAIVLIVVVTAVMIVTKRRKSNHQDAAGKGTCIIIVDVIYIEIQVIHSDNNSNVYLGMYTTWNIDFTFQI